MVNVTSNARQEMEAKMVLLGVDIKGNRYYKINRSVWKGDTDCRWFCTLASWPQAVKLYGINTEVEK